MDPVHILMDPVHGGGPWTRGPCFVLSHYSVIMKMTIEHHFMGRFQVNSRRTRKATQPQPLHAFFCGLTIFWVIVDISKSLLAGKQWTVRGKGPCFVKFLDSLQKMCGILDIISLKKLKGVSNFTRSSNNLSP